MARPPSLPGRPTPAERKEVWLELIRDGVGITKAAEQVGIDKRTTLDWRRKDDAFNLRFQDAYMQGRIIAFDLGRERVEAEVLIRLSEGAVEETYERATLLLDSGEIVRGEELVLTKRVVKRSPADVANALRAYGLDAQKVDVEHTGSVLQEVTLEHDFGKLLDKLAEVGLIQRGPAELADAASVALLPASPD